MSNKKEAKQNKASASIARRELITKYGAYTAPVVVSLLLPKEAYGHATSDVYSTSTACSADIGVGGNMHSPTRTGHCMWGGPSSGGLQAHMVTSPGV